MFIYALHDNNRDRFTLVDVGQLGRHSDGGVFSNSAFGAAFEREELSLPGPRPLPDSTLSMPYVFVGDEAFPLKPNLMRPYPGRNLPGMFVCDFVCDFGSVLQFSCSQLFRK